MVCNALDLEQQVSCASKNHHFKIISFRMKMSIMNLQHENNKQQSKVVDYYFFLNCVSMRMYFSNT